MTLEIAALDPSSAPPLLERADQLELLVVALADDIAADLGGQLGDLVEGGARPHEVVSALVALDTAAIVLGEPRRSRVPRRRAGVVDPSADDARA